MPKFDYSRLGYRVFRPLLAISVSFLLAYQPSVCSAAATAVGQISTQGSTVINGINAVTGSSVFAGDRIATQHDSTASLALSGGRRLILVESSSMQVTNSGGEFTAALDHGRLAIMSPATAPQLVEARGTLIVPGKSDTVYAVQLNGNSLTVTANKGTVAVEAIERTVEVPEGKTLEATLAPALPPGTPQGGAISAVSSHLLTYIVITAVVLAVAVPLIVLNLPSNCSVSDANIGKCKRSK
jgi:hypothetical protein